MHDTTHYRNRSPHGWWVATYIERAAWDDKPELAESSTCLAWENTIILQAPDREAAYSKAVSLGQSTSQFSDKGRSGRWIFEGLVSLLAIHDELKDGAEILWTEHVGRTIGEVRSWVRSKENLEAFDDSAKVNEDA